MTVEIHIKLCVSPYTRTSLKLQMPHCSEVTEMRTGGDVAFQRFNFLLIPTKLTETSAIEHDCSSHVCAREPDTAQLQEQIQLLKWSRSLKINCCAWRSYTSPPFLRVFPYCCLTPPAKMLYLMSISVVFKTKSVRKAYPQSSYSLSNWRQSKQKSCITSRNLLSDLNN